MPHIEHITAPQGAYRNPSSNNRGMPKLAVYRFIVWDKQTGESVESLRFATLKAINLHAGRNIEHSRRIVDDSEIDAKGFLKITKFIGPAPLG